MTYTIILEPTATGYSAYAPDLPGCISTGATRQACEANMQEAVTFHLEGLREEGQAVPEPRVVTAMVEAA